MNDRSLTLSVEGEGFSSTTTLWSIEGFPHLSNSWTMNGFVMPCSLKTCKGLKMKKKRCTSMVYFVLLNIKMGPDKLSFPHVMIWDVYAFILKCWKRNRHEVREVWVTEYHFRPTDEFDLSRDSSRHSQDDLLLKVLVGEAKLSGAKRPSQKLHPRHQDRAAALLQSHTELETIHKCICSFLRSIQLLLCIFNMTQERMPFKCYTSEFILQHAEISAAGLVGNN